MNAIDWGDEIWSFRLSDQIGIKDDITVLFADDSTPVSKDDKFGFACVYCHFVTVEPVGDFFKFSIHKSADFF